MSQSLLVQLMINLLDNLNVETISYMFDQTMEDFLQIDDRIFISSRGTYINRGLIDHVDHNKAKNALLEISLKLQLGSELGTDIKPFIVFAKGFNSKPDSPIMVDFPREMIHIDVNNRVTHFSLNSDNFSTQNTDEDNVFLYPHSIKIISEESREIFCDKVNKATKKIANTELEKVVLARQIKMKADVSFDPRLIVSELIDSQPESYIFSINSFVGATPELLIEKFSRTISLLPMAGTRKRHARIDDDDNDVANLQTNSKDLSEHAFLIENILSKLSTIAYDIAASSTPRVIRLPHVSHLTTPISASVSNDVDLLKLVNLLHPTPAVGGTPLDLALDTIRELRLHPRATDPGRCRWRWSVCDSFTFCKIDRKRCHSFCWRWYCFRI